MRHTLCPLLCLAKKCVDIIRVCESQIEDHAVKKAITMHHDVVQQRFQHICDSRSSVNALSALEQVCTTPLGTNCGVDLYYLVLDHLHES